MEISWLGNYLEKLIQTLNLFKATKNCEDIKLITKKIILDYLMATSILTISLMQSDFDLKKFRFPTAIFSLSIKTMHSIATIRAAFIFQNYSRRTK